MSTGSPATAPAAVPVLEFISLPQRHLRLGPSFLHMYAPQAIVRLEQPGGVTSRIVDVCWVPKRGRQEQYVTPVLDWARLPAGWAAAPETLVEAVPEQERTAAAAIGVMALLMHDLENVEVREVLPIGSGGDYNVLVGGCKRPIQVEGSGIETDRTGTVTSQRIREKWDQVLTCRKKGFVSVTTFDFRSFGVSSELRFVNGPRPKRISRKRGIRCPIRAKPHPRKRPAKPASPHVP